MAHEVESMMYVGETPWHELGVKLETPPANVADALKTAGLAWNVSLEQLQLPDGRPVARFGVVRDSDKSVLGTVGAGYQVMQNQDAFKFFDPFIEAKAATIETAGSLRGGARVWMLAKVERPDSIIVKKADDRVRKYLLLAQGHDGSLAIHVGLTPIRVVCMNTLSAAIPAARRGERRAPSVSRTGMFRIRHSKGAADTLVAVQEVIERADKDFEAAADFFRALAGKKVKSAAQLRAYVDAVFPKPKKDEEPEAGVEEEERAVFTDIEALFNKGRGNDLPGVKGTAWGAYNAVTEYLSWERGRTAETRLDLAWFRGNAFANRATVAAKDIFLAA